MRRRPAAGSARLFSASDGRWEKTWHQPGTPPRRNRLPRRTACPKRRESNKFMYDTSAETGKPLTTHQFYDGTQHPWSSKRVWHLEPSLTDPNTVYAGVEDAAIFRSTDGGTELERAFRNSGVMVPAPKVAARRGWHVPAHHYSRSQQSENGIWTADFSAAGAFSQWTTAAKAGSRSTRGLRSQYIPEPGC